MAKDLSNKMDRGLDTVRKILEVYAPPSENDTEAYIKNVSKRVGVDADEPISKDNLKKLVEAMILQEGGKEALSYYTPDIIEKGFEKAQQNQEPSTGLVEPGNIDLTKRKVLNNEDGSISTESSITVTDDKGIAINIPTVIDGKRYSDREAWDYYVKTGQHLGKYKTVEEAVKAANSVHLQQEKRYM